MGAGVRRDLSGARERRYDTYGYRQRAQLEKGESMVKRICMAGAALLLLAAAAAAETTTQPLFIIERSKNANVVHYDVQLKEGKLDPKEPVLVYWILVAKDGRRDDLNFVERKAYGVDVKDNKAGGDLKMTLNAYSKRDITVRQVEEAFRAEVVIDGKPSIFEKMFVNSTERTLLPPKVNYIELFGKDLETGEKRYEKILP